MKRRNMVQRWWDRRSSEGSLLSPPQWLLDLFGVSNTASGEIVTADSALMNSNVYTCASILGGDVGKLPIQVFKKRGGGIERDSSHPVSKLLGTRSNPYMSAYTFKELMQVHVTVWGNGYANIEWETSGSNNGKPKALWPLDPSKTDVHIDTLTGQIWYVTTLPNGEMRKLKHCDVLHFKGISKSGLKGITPISVIREELGVQQSQRKFLGSFYSNGTATRGILKIPNGTLDKPAKDKARDEWQKANSGLNNAHRIAILDAGMEYQNLGMPLNDAQFIETSKFGIMEVGKIYKVPGYKLGLTDVKFSNMENQSLEYVKSTLQPIFTNWEQECDYKLFTELERKIYYTKYNVSGELRGDSTSRAAYYKEMIAMGAYTINEVRELEERDNIGDMGDKHFVSLNYVSLDKMDQYQMLKAGISKDSPEGG
ncbi:phage portal protein [Paenibacillus macquariensis]|uniref:Phage portal protein, HK97 family n=1 Tax=Paenibacillus macquariensis TaxID=948756 RepID=A0ABY1JS49_9BACL|nr:phage portal protein [Paenibacillus macquariensis]MEC0092877.1 phage portal protein [Paenibacillus macquariensis]OAB36251.1 portal protein [Paenibacillus macquariensis subsp. macquariensis]SIQ67992.1 phage portal protein, HK97 family [Paenibacillus macquariensis]